MDEAERLRDSWPSSTRQGDRASNAARSVARFVGREIEFEAQAEGVREDDARSPAFRQLAAAACRALTVDRPHVAIPALLAYLDEQGVSGRTVHPPGHARDVFMTLTDEAA
jgi:hypothetical protein